MKKIIASLLLILGICLIIGCGKKEDTAIQSQAVTESTSIEPQEPMIPAEDTNTFPVDIVFANLSGIDIGMVSIIDPATKEQLNISGIENETSISIGVNWPKDETEFNWALYNMNGELCIEGSSDLTGMKESATIVLSGDGDVTNIDVQVD